VNDYPVAGDPQIRLAAIIYFGSGDHLAKLSFQLRFGESPFFIDGGGLIQRLTGYTRQWVSWGGMATWAMPGGPQGVGSYVTIG